MRSSSTLSTVFPPRSECAPQELFPIIPPIVQRLCEEGSGAKVSWWISARLRKASRTTPGCTRANFCAVSISRMRFMYFVKSSTTATLQHWPARLVPAPRGSTGAPNLRHAATVATTSWSSRGTTNPMVIWRVCGVQGAAAAVEAHLSLHRALQLKFELRGGRERVRRFSVRTQGQWQVMVQGLPTLEQVAKAWRIDLVRLASAPRTVSGSLV